MKRWNEKNNIVILMTSLVLTGCSSQATDTHQEHRAEEPDRHHGEEDEHEGHEHGDEEGSDLDRPVSELFEATCEHGIKTHECEECRYEVGVVKAPANLFEEGLFKTVSAEKKAVPVRLGLTGEVQFDERRVAHVSTQTEGIIRKVHVALGDQVQQGQPLVSIVSVAVGEAEAGYLQAKALLKLARRNHERIATLRHEGITSEKETLRSQQELEAARIHLDAASGKLTRLGMALSSVRNLKQKNATGSLVLRAPAEGTVLAMHAVAGEIARNDESLITIGDNTSMWVWADLYERDFARVSREQANGALAAEISVRAFPEESFPGTVDFLSPAMSEASRTVKLRIAVPNHEGRLLAGMFANVQVLLSGDQETLVLPKGAVLEDEGRSFVFVHHKEDYYVRRPVETGRAFPVGIEITGGIKGTETVVADGAFLMKSDVLRSKMGAGCAD
ncbi:MAG: efflux RND transporter periplasmic adaptor subunit [Deltaproteobacteria bacterium]|nr:efflux RND transporter periplasmic adaptor subunit [Deltaproteobacteria bacterium]